MSQTQIRKHIFSSLIIPVYYPKKQESRITSLAKQFLPIQLNTHLHLVPLIQNSHTGSQTLFRFLTPFCIPNPHPRRPLHQHVYLFSVCKRCVIGGGRGRLALHVDYFPGPREARGRRGRGSGSWEVRRSGWPWDGDSQRHGRVGGSRCVGEFQLRWKRRGLCRSLVREMRERRMRRLLWCEEGIWLDAFSKKLWWKDWKMCCRRWEVGGVDFPLSLPRLRLEDSTTQ